MGNPLFDVFLACAPKDYNKLPFVLKSIRDNISGYDMIYVCAPTAPESIMGECGVKLVFDYYTLPVDRSKWQYRPNWNFQQHLKLFQNVTSDWYVTLDCDTIINRPLKFFCNDRPVWYKGWEQLNKPYFDFNKKILGLERIETRTFIADMNFIYRPFIQEMLARSSYTIDGFIEVSQRITSRNCYMAEPELYGQYSLRYHPDFYEYEILKQGSIGGRYQKDPSKVIWSEKEIGEAVELFKGKDVDTISFHSWYTGEC